MVTLNWSAEDADGVPICTDQETELPAWADSPLNGGAAVQTAIEGFFADPDDFLNFFGDILSVNLIVTVHAPAALAGRYAVALGLRLNAVARRIPEGAS